MKSYIANRMGDYCSLQVSSLKEISGDYESKTPFLIKNITGGSIEMLIKLVNNSEYISTILDPGWNPEICVGVKEASGIQIGK